MTGRREAFIARRNYVGYTQESLANELRVALATVSGWERGRRNPGSRHRQRMAELLRVSLAELDQLLDPAGRLNVEAHSVPIWLSHYESVVQGAGRVDQIQLVEVPALLQTRNYASALERLGPMDLTDDQVASRVDRRLARQDALDRIADPLHLSVLLSEVVLLRAVGSGTIMAGQIEHLVAVSDRPNIDLRLLPADGSDTVALTNIEVLTRPGETTPFMAITVSLGGPSYVEVPELLGVFIRMLDHMSEVALPPAETTRRLRRLEETYQ